MRLVILDASRNNPFERTKTLTRGRSAAMAGRGWLLAFAAEPGGVTLELSGERNSLYTQHLLEALQESGVPHQELFARVQTAVYGASEGRQTPVTYDALVGDFVFRPSVVDSR